jgi:hypothetical protein
MQQDGGSLRNAAVGSKLKTAGVESYQRVPGETP